MALSIPSFSPRSILLIVTTADTSGQNLEGRNKEVTLELGKSANYRGGNVGQRRALKQTRRIVTKNGDRNTEFSQSATYEIYVIVRCRDSRL